MSYENSLEERGYVITPPLLNETAIADILLELQIAEREQVRSSHETAYSLRNLFKAAPAVRRLAAAHLLRSLVEPSLGADCFAVRALYFDKTPSANWKVPYHQDITVSIAERKETEGFSHWTHKDGVLHTYAPASVLENMLTVRLHLDACGRDNGALRVLPGTHRYGRLNSAQSARNAHATRGDSVRSGEGGGSAYTSASPARLFRRKISRTSARHPYRIRQWEVARRVRVARSC